MNEPSEAMKPGDEAPPGTPGAGENLCPDFRPRGDRRPPLRDVRGRRNRAYGDRGRLTGLSRPAGWRGAVREAVSYPSRPRRRGWASSRATSSVDGSVGGSPARAGSQRRPPPPISSPDLEPSDLDAVARPPLEAARRGAGPPAQEQPGQEEQPEHEREAAGEPHRRSPRRRRGTRTDLPSSAGPDTLTVAVTTPRG